MLELSPNLASRGMKQGNPMRPRGLSCWPRSCLRPLSALPAEGCVMGESQHAGLANDFGCVRTHEEVFAPVCSGRPARHPAEVNNDPYRRFGCIIDHVGTIDVVHQFILFFERMRSPNSGIRVHDAAAHQENRRNAAAPKEQQFHGILFDRSVT